MIGGRVGEGVHDVCYQPLLTGDHILVLGVAGAFAVVFLGFMYFAVWAVQR